MKIVFIGVYANNSSTVVYEYLSFHIFEALNDNKVEGEWLIWGNM